MNMILLSTIIIAYLTIISYLGYRGYIETKNAADYMVGGRNIHPYVMAMSYGAAFISTSAIVGFGGIASLFGMSMLWLNVFNIGVGIFVAFIFYGKKTRRMGLNLNAHTFSEFLGKRLNSIFIQKFSGIIIFVFMPLYAAAVLIGASRIIEGLLGVPYIYSISVFSILVAVYVILGGIKGVMYTDAMQGTLMFFGMIFLLFFIYYKLGGVTEAHLALSSLSDKIPESLKAIGHQGWTSSPKSGTPLWWIIYSSLVLGVGIGVLAQPQLVVRYMTVKSNKELNRAVAIGGVFILISVGTALIVGALSNVYFFNEFGSIAIQVAEGNSDKVIPLFIKEAMPTWFGYIFMLVILAAGISTLSSQFHTIGTAVGRDIIPSKNNNSKRDVLVSKAAILISIGLTVILGIKMEPGIIARATAIFFGLMASSFLAPYTAAIYWKRLTRKGAIAGIISGISTAVLMFLFTHGKEAAVFGISKLIFGKTTILGGVWPFVDPLVIALPVSAVFTIAVTLLTKVENPETVEKSFKGL